MVWNSASPYCVVYTAQFFFALHFLGFLLENNGSRGVGSWSVFVHLCSSVLSVGSLTGEVANTIFKMLRQCEGNSIMILQVIEYNKGQIQTLKSSRNFQIREMRVVFCDK